MKRRYLSSNALGVDGAVILSGAPKHCVNLILVPTTYNYNINEEKVHKI